MTVCADPAATCLARHPWRYLASLLAALFTGPVMSASAPVVVAETLHRQVIEEVPISGTVTSPRVARLSPEVSGLVAEVGVVEGRHVERGAVLLRLDATLAEIELEAAEAATEQAREELSDARRRLKDTQRLVKSRGIAETEYEARRSEVRADSARVNLREAEQRRQHERLRRHHLLAPFAGVISRKLTEAGEWVTPGDEVIELIADRGLRVEFQVPQAYYPRIDGRVMVKVRVDALTDQEILAPIGEIVPVSDPTARTFLVRVYPDAAGLPLTPGMSASGSLRLTHPGRRVVVSRDAVLRHPDGRTTVWIVELNDGDATVSERNVQTGLAFDGLITIRDGLEAGSTVVVEGNEALQHGQAVTIRGSR